MRPPRPPPRIAAGLGATLLGVLAACSTTREVASGALEPRFVAVHNALAAMGLAQVGPIHEGSLAEGQEARVSLDLPSGCTTVVAFGGEGVRDVDATRRCGSRYDASGRRLRRAWIAGWWRRVILRGGWPHDLRQDALEVLLGGGGLVAAGRRAQRALAEEEAEDARRGDR